MSESTVVRFAVAAGYKGYPEFQKACVAMVQNQISSIKKIDISKDAMSNEMIIENVLNSDIEKINDTLINLDRNAFSIAVGDILKARKVYVVGVRNSQPLATFFSFYLKLIVDHVVEVSSSNTSELFEQLIDVNEKDVVIGISFPRYSMRTLKTLEFANNRNARVIAITDSLHSPMNMYSSINLLAKSDMSSLADSLTAPMSLINALIVALFIEKKDEVINRVEMLEHIWEDYQVYVPDEINYIDEDVRDDLKNMLKGNGYNGKE